MIERIFDFIRQITFGDCIVFLLKIIVLCFIYAFVIEGIDTTVSFIKCLTRAWLNKKTSKVIKKFSEKKVIPYKKADKPSGEVIDISSLLLRTPKIVAKINVLTGDIVYKNVFKNRGLPVAFLFPDSKGKKESLEITTEEQEVVKNFIYCESIVNTLNLYYFGWKEFNPDLNTVLEQIIVPEEVLLPYLKSFHK